MDDKIKEIDATLSQLILVKKTRRVASLQIKREALIIPKTSQNTEDYIDNILVATKSGESNIKVSGRPKKASCKHLLKVKVLLLVKVLVLQRVV